MSAKTICTRFKANIQFASPYPEQECTAHFLGEAKIICYTDPSDPSEDFTTVEIERLWMGVDIVGQETPGHYTEINADLTERAWQKTLEILKDAAIDTAGKDVEILLPPEMRYGSKTGQVWSL